MQKRNFTAEIIHEIKLTDYWPKLKHAWLQQLDLLHETHLDMVSGLV